MKGGHKRWDVPDTWRDAAEEVRAHLCALRGGAPFLSPSDALLLVGWFERGVAVGDILRALERARELRRIHRSRYPLNLNHARRHLGRPTRGAFARERPARGSEPVFTPVVRAMRSVPGRGPARRQLEHALVAIDLDGEPAVRQALVYIREFFDVAWIDMGEEGRARLRARARAELGDLLSLVDEGTAAALIEETARDLLRQTYPTLSAASLWELVRADGT